MSLLSALIIPVVTVPPKVPRGLPIAMQFCATCNLSESPNTADGRLSTAILITAISLTESVPIKSAS